MCYVLDRFDSTSAQCIVVLLCRGRFCTSMSLSLYPSPPPHTHSLAHTYTHSHTHCRYDPPGTVLPPAISPKQQKRASFTTYRNEEDTEEYDKNFVHDTLRRSRNLIISALRKAKTAPELTLETIAEVNKKDGNGEKKEVKRPSIMSIQSNSTDISRVCSKEAYEDWLVSDELLDILSSDTANCSPMHSRRPSNESQGAWNLFVANNVKTENSSAFPSDNNINSGTASHPSHIPHHIF